MKLIGELIFLACIVITEMDKIGASVNGKGGGFYTREDWGQKDQPNLWGSNNYSEYINYSFADKDSIWGSDDDTDIEYIYQEIIAKKFRFYR